MRDWISGPVLLGLATAGLATAWLTTASIAAAATADPAEKLDPVNVEGLRESVRVRRDFQDVPHIFALNDHDALFMLGYVHAQDRLFQMDVSRRLFSGTLAELVGAAALPQDVQLRTLGLRRAAEESIGVLTSGGLEWLEAYTAGVNAYLGNPANPLPPEYGVLETDRAGIPPWTALDSLTVTKGLAFGLSFDLSDLDASLAIMRFNAAGGGSGFNGPALYFEDLYRIAPFDPSVSIPGALSGLRAAPAGAGDAAKASPLPPYLGGRTRALIERYTSSIRATPLLARALDRRDTPVGSNWWIAGGSVTDSGFPMLANDPHLALDTPATFYEAHLRVNTNGDPPFNVTGVTFPGTPVIAQGCNPWICWGSTVNSVDVTDVYVEALVFDPVTQLPTSTVFGGTLEPLVLIPQTFRVNVLGDGTIGNLADAGVGPLEGGLTLVVPRRNRGPIVQVDTSEPESIIGISVQYTGWRATQELEAFRQWARARNLDDFVAGLQFFDFGSQNFAYADIDGNIAYFTSGETPVREDLQNNLSPAGGIPPFLVRDGTHGLQHEWLPVQNPQPNQSLAYEILPFAELPQEVNPARGYILNANNDPIGTTLDNNPLNQLRPGGGLYYLSGLYDGGLRMGRLQRLFDAALAGGGELSIADLMAFQANNQLLDAEVFIPHLETAFANAGAPDAPAELAALAADPRIGEAIGRLADWDFSTPTGIREGYDPGDDPANLPAPSQAEIDASVAATIYAVWRGQVLDAVFTDTLALFGLDDLVPGSQQALSALRNLLENFPTRQGLGVSGVDFFIAQSEGLSKEEVRDGKLLGALAEALDLLAGDAFAPAFAGSVSQSDYRWGYLHRIVFAHPLGGPFDVPPAGGLDNLAEDLPGLARAGGLGALDASSHGAYADSVDEFMFSAGPSRRFVGELEPQRIEAFQVIPGGESGVLGSPFQADQLLLWLTNQYHPVWITPDEVIGASRTFQRFLPTP